MSNQDPAAKLVGVRGMNDILPGESQRWERFEDAVRRVMRAYGYQNMRAPVVEPTALFVRGIGEVTDIVEKEMYSFEDRLNGEQLTLRPEFTAGLVRAVNEHNLLYDGPRRVWCMGPVFRHERPQRGRYRQFHQVDMEAFGLPGPDIDAEVIAAARRLLCDELGLEGIGLQINCLGLAEDRARHRKALVDYLSAHESQLDADARRRLHTNPLRILDSKNPQLQPLLADAPSVLDYLGDDARAHFDGLRSLLDAAGIGYSVNARLVRGLDYYNLTVFEFVTDQLGAQGTVCGGGRYDGLIGLLGGKPAPAIGWGMGIERVLDLLQTQGRDAVAQGPDLYVVVQSEALRAAALTLAERLRGEGWSVLLHAGAASLKSQFKRADASQARLALVVAEAEWARGEVAIKPLRGARPPAGEEGAGSQITVAVACSSERIRELLQTEPASDR
jgi:histidyl-tRNA synthetase